MKKIRRNGFILLFILVMIALIGIQLFVLTAVGNIMSYHSDDAYLEACERNLRASGLAWAKRNIQNNGGDLLNTTVQLDTTEMDIRGSVLNVNISIPEGGEPEVRINTSCTRGRHTIKRDNKYTIKL